MIYEQEIIDGLSEKISNNMSIAFQCLVNKGEDFLLDAGNEEIRKTIAGFIEDGRNFDLYHISSILASVNDNKNDDWFLAEEILAASKTPIYKQVNYGHNEKDIVGVITGTTLLDTEGAQLTDISNVQNIRDIVAHAVIWSFWEDVSLKDRFVEIIDDIENNRLFVSMESLFKNFDYMLVKDGVMSIVTRSKETSFLTKYLRIYGGEGVYNGSRIYRLLRNFTFSGMALVKNPANARSIISDNLRPEGEDSKCCDLEDSDECFKEVAKDKNVITKSLAENIMDPNEIAINALKAELAQAKAELETFKAAEAEKTSAEINELKAANDLLQKQVAELTSLAQAAKEDMEKAKCKSEEDEKVMKEECELKVAEANAKIAALEVEKVTAARLNQLLAANIESAKAEDIMKTWASASDEHFTKVVELYAKAPEKATASETSAEDKEVEAFDLDPAKATASVVNPNGDSDLQKAVAKEKALAEKIAAQFNFTKKNKKGSK